MLAPVLLSKYLNSLPPADFPGCDSELPAWARAWETGTATAVCRRTRHAVPPPTPGCTCGIYAWKRPVDPGRVGRDVPPHFYPSRVAVGVVRLWGQMCDGPATTGYRAERARVVALVADEAGRFDPNRYPDVRVYPNLRSMYSEWDVTPELGFATDAPVAESRRRLVERLGCLACGDPITSRHKTVDYGGRNPWASGAEIPVRFHRRAACVTDGDAATWGASSAYAFDRAWLYANRQPGLLHCPGTRTDHQDGTYDCTEGESCPTAGWRNGELVRHAKVQTCFDEYWPCHVCELRCLGLLRPGEDSRP